jgi:hypothetical protein
MTLVADRMALRHSLSFLINKVFIFTPQALIHSMVQRLKDSEAIIFVQVIDQAALALVNALKVCTLQTQKA